MKTPTIAPILQPQPYFKSEELTFYMTFYFAYRNSKFSELFLTPEGQSVIRSWRLKLDEKVHNGNCLSIVAAWHTLAK